MIFGCSIAAYKRARTTVSHTGTMIEAVSQLEAEGIAMRCARKEYPAAEGWSEPSIAVWPSSSCVGITTAPNMEDAQ